MEKRKISFQQIYLTIVMRSNGKKGFNWSRAFFFVSTLTISCAFLPHLSPIIINTFLLIIFLYINV
uniref:Uncharacterized protein n=1 Tax=Tetranychus urticae TaxID=32264 RepID=T1KS33_TETUR